jgi:hypothetical protein
VDHVSAFALCVLADIEPAVYIQSSSMRNPGASVGKVIDNTGRRSLPACPDPVASSDLIREPDHSGADLPRKSLGFHAAEPLWQRVPKKDRDGRLLSDFMMLIPGLKRRSDAEIKVRLHAIYLVLKRYGDAVAFVELNLRLNTLWVSVEARPGLCLDIPVAIQAVVPEALLVGQQRAER